MKIYKVSSSGLGRLQFTPLQSSRDIRELLAKHADDASEKPANMTKTDLTNLETLLYKLKVFNYQAAEVRMPTENKGELHLVLTQAPPEVLSPAEQRAAHDDSSYASRARHLLKLANDDG